jgi:hypothetical protein
MTDSLLIAIAASGFIGLFAFGLAWYPPLFSPDVPSDSSASNTFRQVSPWGLIADAVLLSLDKLPVFSLFTLAQNVRHFPQMIETLRQRWRGEASIRICFWIWMASWFPFVGAISFAILR